MTKLALKKKLKALGIKTYRGKIRKADVKRVLAISGEETCEVCGSEDDWTDLVPGGGSGTSPTTQYATEAWICSNCGSEYTAEYHQVAFTLDKEGKDHLEEE